jgi:predicted metalloendopeptidase
LQVWCNNISPEAQQERLLTDPHSPGRFRVLGTMANSIEWHDAFSCERPKDTCRLW